MSSVPENGEQLRTLRLELKMDQEKFAKHVGIPPDEVGRIERGDIPLDRKLAMAAAYMKVSGAYPPTYDGLWGVDCDDVIPAHLKVASVRVDTAGIGHQNYENAARELRGYQGVVNVWIIKSPDGTTLLASRA